MDVSALVTSAMSMQPGSSGAALGNAHTPAAQRKAVAGQFEAILVRQFLSGSIGAMLGGDDSAAGNVYGYMLTDALSQKLSQGAGIGLSKMIENQLTPRGTPPADPSAPTPSA